MKYGSNGTKSQFFHNFTKSQTRPIYIEELTKHLGIFGYISFCYFGGFMKVSNQICKSENDLSRMNYEPKTGWESGQWYFVIKIFLTYCEKNF